MLGKVLLAAFLLVPVGIALGLTNVGPLEGLGTVLFLAGSAILGLVGLLALAFLLEGLLFRRSDRWRRFN